MFGKLLPLLGGGREVPVNYLWNILDALLGSPRRAQVTIVAIILVAIYANPGVAQAILGQALREIVAAVAPIAEQLLVFGLMVMGFRLMVFGGRK
ncbi:MAG: hypothetical protein Q8Q18_03905 [bacterium]|nr:hypothetical protein [bacterium]